MKTITLYEDRPADHVVLLGMLGFSYKLIAERTGYSSGAIGRILHDAGVRLRDYRDGKSVLAFRVVESAGKAKLNGRYSLELK